MKTEHCSTDAALSRRRWWMLSTTLLVLLACMFPGRADAFVSGDPPVLYQQFRLFGDAEVTGNSLMLDTCPSVNTVLLTESSGDITNVPPDAVVEGAYLFWSASATTPDSSAVLQLPGGASQIVNAQGACHSVGHLGGSYGCKSDVTNFVRSNPAPGGSYNGVYTVRGVNGSTGLVDMNCQCLDAFCQAKFAGWSIVIVYSSPTERTQRDVFLYDGFRVIDEELNTAGQDQFTITGFDVGSPPEARLSFFALEGDRQLGIPPQDLTPGAAGCPDGSCVDSVELNGTPLTDSFNAAGNIFNGSVPGGFAVGVDLDSYDVSPLVAPGDTTATVRLVSGDGTANNSPASQHGYGEYVIVNWMLMRLNRLAPNFGTDKTFLDAIPTSVAPGGTVFFTLNVTNEGSLDATGVVVTDVLPPELEYVPGTTTIDGTPIPDVGGQSPVEVGLNLGNLPHLGDNDRRIRFEVRVRPTVLPGTIVLDDATIDAVELDMPITTNTVQIDVIGAVINTPTKIDKDLNGGSPAPNDIIEYEVFVSKQGNVAVGGLEFRDDMSPWVVLTDLPSGNYDVSGSSFNGGVNGTGQIVVTNIDIPGNQAGVFIRYKVRVLSSAELIAKGVPPADINGLAVENQGSLVAPFLPMALVTDDPATGPNDDPTIFTLSTGVDFTGPDTNKLAIDVNGGLLVPGDTIEFILTFTNNGSQPGTVNISDDLPPFMTNVVLTTPLPQVVFAPPPAGANGTGRLVVSNLIVAPGASTQVAFTAELDAAATDGTSIINVADMTIVEDAAQNRPLPSHPLMVFNRPLFDSATKTVVNVSSPGGFQPGDTVRYTMTVVNDGSQTATSVVVTDPVDPSLENVTPLNGGVFDVPSQSITWNLGDMTPGANRVVEFTATIGLAVPNGTVVANQALIQGTNSTVFLSDDPTSPADDDPTVFMVEALPDFTAMTKTFVDENGGAIEPGDSILYTLSFTNTGRAVSTNTVVRDVVDVAFANITALDAGIYNGATRTITWNLGTVPVGAMQTVRFRASLNTVLPVNTQVSNQGFIDSTEVTNVPSDDPSTPADDDPTVFPVDSSAIVDTSTKTVTDLNGGTFQPGDVVAYEITVINTGNAPATNVVITDPVDPNLTNVAPQDGGFYDGALITWNVAAQLDPGASLVVRFEAQIDVNTPDGSPIANQASIAGTGIAVPTLTDDPTTPVIDDPTTFTVVRLPEFATSTKTVAELTPDGEFSPGETIVYALEVINSGTDDATNVVVVDDIDPNLTNLVPSAGGVVAGNTVTWTIPLIPAGNSVTVNLNADILNPLADGILVPNQARITSTEIATPVLTDDPSTPIDDDPTEFTVTSRPRFDGASKTFVDVNGGNVEPGDRIEYTLTYTNEGTDAALNVVITDQVDGNLVNINVLDGGVFNNMTRLASWSFATIPALAQVDPGQTVVLRLNAEVISPIANLTQIDNQAFLAATNVTTPVATDDPLTTPDDDPTSFTVISAADLTGATKIATPPGPDGYRPGDTVTWTLEVTNTGTDAARSVTLTDVVDPNLINVTPLDGGMLSGATITWPVGIIQVGDTVTVQFRADILSPLMDGTLIANQAQYTSPEFGSPVLTDDPNTPSPDDPTVIVVTSAPRFSASTKAVIDLDGDGFFEPGDRVRYDLTIINDGDSPGADIVVTDTVDVSRLTNIVPLSGGNIAGNTIDWFLPNLNAGAQTILSFEADIIPGLANGTSIANQGVITTPDGRTAVTDDPATPAMDDPTIIVVTAEARLGASTKIVEDLNGAPLIGGEPIRYTLEIRNDGTEPATNVRVVDPLDPSLTSIIVNDPRAVVSPVDIVWTLGTIPPGGVEILIIDAVVLPGTPDGTTIANQADIVADGPILVQTDDPSTPADDDATLITINADPELSESTKTVLNLTGGQFLRPGDTLEYTITVINSGFGNADNLVVSDAIPANLVNIQPQNGGLVQGNTIVWNAVTTMELASIPPQGLVALTFTAEVAPGTPSDTIISNQAQVVEENGQAVLTDDPGTAAVDDATTIQVRYPSLAVVEKTVVDMNGGNVEPGDDLQYVIRLVVAPGIDLPDVTITDVLDPNLSIILIDDGGVIDAGGTITWNPGTTPALALLPEGSVFEVNFIAQVSPGAASGTFIPNQATVVAPTLGLPVRSDDPTTPPSPDPTVVVVNDSSGPDFSASTKDATDINGGVLQPGETIEYRIIVQNDGRGVSSQARLFEVIPPNTTYVGGSTTLNGLSVGDRPGGLAPLDGLSINGPGQAPGVIAVGERAEIRFRVEVQPGTPGGTLITNQARISALGGFETLTDGDPSTPNVDEATLILVGEGGALRQTTKVGRFDDVNGNSLLDAGEEIIYTFTISSVGNEPVSAIVLEDDIPPQTTYVPGFLTLNGRVLTEANDGDEGRVEGGRMAVAVSTLGAGENAVVEFRVRADVGGSVVNQGTVTAMNVPSQRTDDPSRPGPEDPTIVGQAGVVISKSVEDLNGGQLQLGDAIRYVIRIENLSGEEERNLLMTDFIPSEVVDLTVESSPMGTTFELLGDQFLMRGIHVQPGTTATIQLGGVVGGDATLGREFCNTATLDVNGERISSNAACATPSDVPDGFASVFGVVVHDVDGDGALGDNDPRLSNYRVDIHRAADPNSGVVASLTSGPDGDYRTMLPVGQYRIRYYTERGVRMGEVTETLVLSNQEDRNQPILVDPQGIIYDSKTGNPLTGIQVFAFYDETDPISPGELVGPTGVAQDSNQQGQLTSADGFYRFDFNPLENNSDPNLLRRYRLEVSLTNSQTLQFPSIFVPPQPGIVDVGVDPILIVDNALPDINAEQRYFLRFGLSGGSAPEGAQNNHIPLDPIQSLISMDKRVDKPSASVGDVVTYKLTIQNRSDRDIMFDVTNDPTEAFNGVFIQDEFPPEAAIRYAENSVRATLFHGDDKSAIDVAVDDDGTTTGRAILRFGRSFGQDVVGMDLPAGGRIEVLYRGVVGIKAEPNKSYRNTATLFGTGNVRLSDSDSADVRVIADPIFDQGIVLGKVFCDADGDGFQDAGEEGVYHARIMLDTGYYAMTDEYGKYHFHDVDPGSHQIKIDTASLPVGSGLTTAESLVFYASRGLPTKTNFGLTCPTPNVVEVTDVQVGDETARAAEDEFRENYINVKGNLDDWTTTVDETTYELMRPTLSGALASAGEDADVDGIQVAMGASGLSDGLVFTTGVAAGPAPSRWKLVVVAHGAGNVVYEQEGVGSPPASIEWDGTDAAGNVVLTASTVYRARLDMVGDRDDFGRSAPVLFLVTGSAEEVVNMVVIDELSSPLFNRKGEPTRALEKWVTDNKAMFTLLPEGAQLVIEAHTDDELPPFEAFDITSGQLTTFEALVRKSVTLPADVKFVSRGSDYPFMPNLDEESRLQNRRLVVKHVVQQSAGADNALPQLDLAVSGKINDYAVPFGDRTFDVLVPKPGDGLLVIDVTDADGSRAIKAVRIEVADAGVEADVPVVPVVFTPGDEASITLGAGATATQTSAGLYGTDLRVAGGPFEIAAGALKDPARIAMRIRGDASTRSWLLEIKNVATGEVVYRVKDDGDVPRTMRWSGATKDNTLLSGVYVAELTVLGSGASRGVSTPVYFAITDAGETAPELPTVAGEAVLRVNGRRIQQGADGNYNFDVSGYTGEAFLLDYTDAEGVRVVEPVILPKGYERPGSHTDAPEIPGPDMDPAPEGTVAPENGNADIPEPDQQPAPNGASGPPDGTEDIPAPDLEPNPDATPVEGGETPGIPEPDLDTPSTRVSPDAMPRSRARIRAQALAALDVPDADGYLPLRGHRLGVSGQKRSPRFRLMMAQPAEPGAGAPTDSDVAADGVEDADGTEPASTDTPVGDPTTTPGMAVTPTPPPMGDVDTSDLATFGATELDAALAAEGIIDMSALRNKARAGNLKVALPPADMKLPRNDLVVAGVTDPANQILVNGKEVRVKHDGTFKTVAMLPDGESTLSIEAVDPEGNRGRIEWPVSVEPIQYFLMAFADTAISSSNMRLAGSNDHNSWDTGDGVVLYGQAKLYFKGHMKGSEMGTDFFEAYNATAYVDTSRKAEFEEMFSTLIQPEEYYPVYGDSSNEVHDVNARGKLYLLVEADETYLKMANFRADVKGIQYFDYARTFYGLDAAFNKTFADDYDTHARFFVAGDSFLGDGSSRLRHTFNYMRGTGGSLYFLEHDHVVEGTEQVTLVVKDNVTGNVLARVPQTRNVDYTVRYADGRILFKSPVPSVADGTFLTGQGVTTRNPMDGHAVLIEVGYEYEADASGGGTSFGGQIRETMFDNKLSIGVGYVQEGRGGALAGEDYQLIGTDLAYRHSQGSFLEAEFARSRSYDAFAAMSDDGGLSFGEVQRRDGIDDVGNAYHAKGSFELADVLETDRTRILEVGGFYSQAEDGFYANRNALERGNQTFGGHGIYRITDEHAVGVRNDSVLARVDDFVNPNPDALKTMARYVTRAHYDYTGEDHRAGVEYNYSFADDFFAVDGYGMHTTAVHYEFAGVDGLTLGISQEAVVDADDKRLVNDTMDRFTTGISASWEILDDLAVEAVEKIRWNGENSTRLGLRTQLSEKASAYVQQRFTNRESGRGFTTSTVLGGEQKFFEDNSGRAFGEYQIDGGVYGQRNRAIAGLGKKWMLGKGVVLDTAYERTQVFGAGGQGDSSRDVISVGFELTRYDWIKAASRIEFRYDDGDLTAPQDSPCASNGVLDTPEFCRDKHTGGFDRFQVVSLNNVDWKWGEDLTFLARYNLAMTENLTLDALEQIDQEVSFGLALRPVTWDVLNVLLKYTWLDSQRPLALEDYATDRTQKHVVSLVPIFELPHGIQIIHKLAWKRVISDLTSFADENLPSVMTDTLMYILRVNYRIWRMTEELTLEIGGEYRFLKQFDPEAFEHGFLLELDVVVMDYLRVGVGYNFTSFSDNEFADENDDSHGWFIRLQGTY